MKKNPILIGIIVGCLIALLMIVYSSRKTIVEIIGGTNGDSLIIGNQNISLACAIDEDCALVDKALNYRSCWPGACAQVDYSLDKYVAVNKISFELYTKSERDILESQLKLSTPKSDPGFPPYGGGGVCGSPPMCPTSLINGNFYAKCVSGQCKKLPR